jgi:hypothetical protein
MAMPLYSQNAINKSIPRKWARPDSNRRPPPCEGSFSRSEPLEGLL